MQSPPGQAAATQTATAALAATLTELRAAVGIAVVAVPAAGPLDAAMLAVLRSVASSGGNSFGGLFNDLGFAPAGASIGTSLSVAGTALSLELTNPAERQLADLSLGASTLQVSLDHGAAQPALRTTLDAQARIGLAGDSFIALLMPGGAFAETPLQLALAAAQGLTINGSRRRVSLPARLNLSAVQLRDTAIVLPEGPGAGPFEVAIVSTIGASIGPVSAVVEELGVGLDFDQAALLGGTGALTVVLHPPTGAGLSIDAGVVRGGGYLSHTGNTYGGALDLRVGPVEVKAVGLVTTDPFSLVVVLSVEFQPAIQLSFGFTLNGVGGLLALERTVATDALRAGLRTHVADQILFPPDPVRAAPTILAALQNDFPPQQGGFVVGPMLEIGWGTPVSYVTAKVGVIIAVPDVTVILLGAVRVALPTPDAAIVDIRAELYGEITPQHLLFLVSLQGSQIAGFPLGGDFGMLIDFGDDPQFALSAGGFHPRFRPPGELAGMHRVSVDLSPPALLSLHTQAYFALTTNTVQLGAAVQLRADVAGIGAEGHLSFDALVRWAPTFAFEVDLRAGVSLYALGETFAGIDLRLHLAGPGPWTAQGSASISLLFFDIDFDVGPITWGEGDSVPADSVSPVALVADALRKPGAWSARPPGDTDRVVHFAVVDDPPSVLVHPLGALEARQRAVPLETVLDRVGRHPVSEKRVAIGQPMVGGIAAGAVSYANDEFPPGMFLDLSDDDKLGRPAFESFPAGVGFAATGTYTFGTPAESTYQWDTVFPHEELPRLRYDVSIADHVLGLVLAAGPAGGADRAYARPYAVPPSPVRLADPGLVTIRDSHTLSPVAGMDGQPMRTTDAARLVGEATAANPDLAGNFVLVGAGAAS